jgi:uncharacterized protein (DUF433 family)
MRSTALAFGDHPMTTATRTATPMPHIWLDERGRAWIDETNVKVIEVVLDTLGPDRLTPERIFVEHYQRISMAQIHAAFTYYYDHQAEFDAEIERQDKMVEELRAKSLLNDPIRAKLRATGKIP